MPTEPASPTAGHAAPVAPGTAPAVLVVIPTLNEVRHIEAVLDALEVDLPAAAALQFVVVDGGSSDGTPELVQRLCAQRPRLRLLHNPQRLQSAAVNLAAKVYGEQAEALVRCDAHAVYPPGYVRRLLDTLQRTQADAVVVPMDGSGSGCLQRAVAWVSDTPAGSGGSAHRGGRRSAYVDHGHHAAFRMASFRRAGGYDESYSHNEDAELDCRQRALGGRIYLDADIRLAYHPRDSWRGLWRQYFNYGAGRARTVRRHRGSMRLRQAVVPAHFVLCALAFMLATWLPALLLWPLLYLLVLAGVSLQLALARRSACALLGGPAAAVMHLAWASGFFWSLATVREARWQASPPGRRAPQAPPPLAPR